MAHGAPWEDPTKIAGPTNSSRNAVNLGRMSRMRSRHPLLALNVPKLKHEAIWWQPEEDSSSGLLAVADRFHGCTNCVQIT